MKLYNLWNSSDEKFLYMELGGDGLSLRWVDELIGGRRIFLCDDDVVIFEQMHTLYVDGGFNDPEDCEYIREGDKILRAIYKFVNTTMNWRTMWFLPVVNRFGSNTCNMDFINGFQI